MKYNETNLRTVLRKIDETAYDIYCGQSYDNMAGFVREMFARGFGKVLKNSMAMRIRFSASEISILTRAYNDLYGSGHGYFEFDKED